MTDSGTRQNKSEEGSDRAAQDPFCPNGPRPYLGLRINYGLGWENPMRKLGLMKGPG